MKQAARGEMRGLQIGDELFDERALAVKLSALYALNEMDAEELEAVKGALCTVAATFITR